MDVGLSTKIRVQLLDFGLAAEVRSSMSRVSLRGHAGSSGTPAYMAPEQWEARPQSAATDQYALAVMAYQMLSGSLPFDADDTDLLRRAVLSRAPDPVPGLSRAANAALLRALAKDPAARFPSCTAFVDALSRGVHGGRLAGTARPTRSRFALAAAADEALRKPAQNKSERKTVCRTKGQRVADRMQLWEGGPYWGIMNIGAEKPEDYGLYFWWGDTVGYRRKNGFLQGRWVASDDLSRNFSFLSDNAPTYGQCPSFLQNEGRITAAGVLVPEHDVAQVQWGGAWRIPTYQEFRDLASKCDWRWVTMNGVNGYVIHGRSAFADSCIFLPAAGRGDGPRLFNAGSFGYYWSSIPDDNPYSAWNLSFSSGGRSTADFCYRYLGFSIRPVQGFAE